MARVTSRQLATRRCLVAAFLAAVVLAAAGTSFNPGLAKQHRKPRGGPRGAPCLLPAKPAPSPNAVQVGVDFAADEKCIGNHDARRKAHKADMKALKKHMGNSKPSKSFCPQATLAAKLRSASGPIGASHRADPQGAPKNAKGDEAPIAGFTSKQLTEPSSGGALVEAATLMKTWPVHRRYVAYKPVFTWELPQARTAEYLVWRYF